MNQKDWRETLEDINKNCKHFIFAKILKKLQNLFLSIRYIWLCRKVLVRTWDFDRLLF